MRGDLKIVKLKVGHVGGRVGYARLFQAHPKTEVVAVCDVNPLALEKVRKELGLRSSQCYRDYDEFLKVDMDIVVIGTPIPFHAEQSIKAMEAGLHVLSEVTAANTVEDCKRLVETVKRTKMKYMLAENMCYAHFIREWIRIVREGKLGEIYYAEGEYIHKIRHLIRDPKTGKLLWRAQRPPIHYCSHSLGPLLMIVDDYVVKATGSGRKARIMPDVGVGGIDMQVALFETKKGATIKILRSQTVAREPPFHYYSIYGTKGCLENGRLGFKGGVSKGIIYIEGEDKVAREVEWHFSDPHAPKEAWAGGHGTTEYYIVRDFLNSIINDTTPPIDVVKGVDMTIPGLIAHKAAMIGNVWLDVPHFE